MNWRKLFPWVGRSELTHRDAIAAGREADLICAQRPLVERIVYELGLHQRDNHFIDLIQTVTKGKA